MGINKTPAIFAIIAILAMTTLVVRDARADGVQGAPAKAPGISKSIAHQMEVLPDGQIQVRIETTIKDEDKEFPVSYHRYVLPPGADLSKEPAAVADVARSLWTGAVVTAYRLAESQREPGLAGMVEATPKGTGLTKTEWPGVITVKTNGDVLVSRKTTVTENGRVLATTLTSETFTPGDAVTSADTRVRAVMERVWTPDVVAKGKARKALK